MINPKVKHLTNRAHALRRREFLRIGLGGIASLSLPVLNQLRAATVPKERTAIIVVWLPGGASHLETYDPKPNATSEYRGPYGPIETRTPGLQLCELLPRHAELSDRFTILRSLVHTGFCHQQGTQQLLTGHPVREMRNKPDDPDFLAIANSLRRDSDRSIPIPELTLKG